MSINQKLYNIDKDKKLFSVFELIVGTYLGGPLAGTYMMAKNFENFGDKNKASIVYKYGVLFSIVLFTTVFFIPEVYFEYVPNYVIPIVYTVFYYFLINKYQIPSLNKHFANGGARESGWKVLGAALVATLIAIAYLSVLDFFIQ